MKQVATTIDPEAKRALTAEAKSQKVSEAQLLRIALYEYLMNRSYPLPSPMKQRGGWHGYNLLREPKGDKREKKEQP